MSVKYTFAIFLAIGKGALKLVPIGIIVSSVAMKFALKKLPIICVTGSISSSISELAIALKESVGKITIVNVAFDGAVKSGTVRFVFVIITVVSVAVGPSVFAFAFFQVIFPATQIAAKFKTSV